MSEPTWIEEAEALEKACAHWRTCACLALDTEFVRERTFFPALGLLQVSDGSDCWLIDPLKVDLSPFQEVLNLDSVVKVLHSCSEDMEVLFNRFHELPWPVVDTQIAAAFAGFGLSFSYRNLVAEICGVDIPKDETRTNWLRRPLTAAQLRYAALDVTYLLPCYHELSERLGKNGRSAWLAEELERLRDTSRFTADPDKAYLKTKGARGLPKRPLAVARELASWREHEARKRNLPRSFILPNAALPQIARMMPRNVKGLENIKGLRPDQRKRFGKAIIDAVKKALALPDSELPIPPKRPLDLSPHKEKVNAARSVVAETAAELDLPPELLANRRTVEKIVRRAIEGHEDPLAPELNGWRRPLVEERLLACLS